MNKARYKESSGDLRKLLSELPVTGGGRTRSSSQRYIRYKFGAIENTDGYLVYLGTAQHVIGVVKFTEDKAIIRYRVNSHYAGILSTYCYPNRENIHVKSNTLRRYRRVARDHLQPYITEAIMARRVERNRVDNAPVTSGVRGLSIAPATTWPIAEQNFAVATRNLAFEDPAYLLELANDYKRHLLGSNPRVPYVTTIDNSRVRDMADGESRIHRVTFTLGNANVHTESPTSRRYSYSPLSDGLLRGAYTQFYSPRFEGQAPEVVRFDEL